MDGIRDGWFTEWSPDQRPDLEDGESSNGDEKDEVCCSWRGQAFSLQVDQILYHKRSGYQDILVFKSKTYGHVLVLDGIIQCTERDEFAYQEMLAHVPLFSHADPQNVLIIGGGDGGILREVLRHQCVRAVTLCEIDEEVIEVSKEYLPKMSTGFDDPKLTLVIKDGFEFLKTHKKEFDVIITDSSDPLGSAKKLFSDSFYVLVRDALRSGGIAGFQGQCPWIDLELVAQIRKISKHVFPSSAYAMSSTPTYTSGLMGYWLCSVDKNRDLRIPKRKPKQKEIHMMDLKYYNAQVHEAAFSLPQFVKDAVDSPDSS